jgi:peptidyl-prolyl cis-trans isomerase SurA
MKYLFTISLFFLTGVASAQQSIIDKVVAQVGDNVVLLSDVQAQKIQAIQSGMKPDRTLDCQIIEDMMYQYLLLNQAKLDSIEIPDQQVDAEMENRLRMIENTIGGRDKMEAFYGKSVTQIKEEFRSIIKDQLLAREMEHNLTSDISVTPREVEKFYKGLPFDSIPLINAQMSFQQIVIYPSITDKDKNRAYEQLQEIRNDIIRNGKSFSTQARIHSMDPGSSSEGGTITATRGMMVPQFESAVFDLEPGDVSDIFETEYGYHIVKLNERKGDNYICQHILIIPEYTNDQLEAAAYRMDSCYSRLMAREITWEQAVLEYSNDEATRQNKGIITNPITGEQLWDIEDLNQVDQQIYLLTDNMGKGDISQPNIYYNMFERKQGVRIVRLMDRTTPHRANLQDDYVLIKRAAENQKKQEIIAEWAQSNISKVYVRVDEEYKDCAFRFKWNLK